MKWWPTFKCPFCAGIIPNREFPASGPITCPTCSRQLQLSRRYSKFISRIGTVLTLALCYLLGLRGLRFFAAFVIFWFPVLLAWDFIFIRVIPPRFEAYAPREPKVPRERKPKSSGSDLGLFH